MYRLGVRHTIPDYQECHGLLNRECGLSKVVFSNCACTASAANKNGLNLIYTSRDLSQKLRHW